MSISSHLAFITDDNEINLKVAGALLKRLGWSVETFDNARAMLQRLEDVQPASILLDISMPGMDGLEAARQLAQLEQRPAVVFCTAYDEHALSAFEAAALDYLVKPVRPERLAATLERVRAYHAARPEQEGSRRTQLCARLRGSLRVIPIEEVHYLQAEEKYVVVHHARGEDLIEEPLKALEEEFGDRFVRIHRNCLVARQELVELRRGADGHVQAVLRSGGVPLEVSRRCVPHLKQTLLHL